MILVSEPDFGAGGSCFNTVVLPKSIFHPKLGKLFRKVFWKPNESIITHGESVEASKLFCFTATRSISLHFQLSTSFYRSAQLACRTPGTVRTSLVALSSPNPTALSLHFERP